MMKYWKLYKTQISLFFITCLVYLLLWTLIISLFEKNSDVNEIVHEIFDSVWVGVGISLLVLNFPFGKDYYPTELDLLMLLPVKRICIVINQFVRYIIVVTIPILTVSMVTFLLFYKYSLNINQFIDEILEYLFMCIHTVIVSQPIFIWVLGKNKQNNKVKILAAVIYLLISGLAIAPLSILELKSGFIFFYNSLFIKNIVILMVYTFLILILSFLITYRLLLKKEF